MFSMWLPGTEFEITDPDALRVAGVRRAVADIGERVVDAPDCRIGSEPDAVRVGALAVLAVVAGDGVRDHRAGSDRLAARGPQPDSDGIADIHVTNGVLA